MEETSEYYENEAIKLFADSCKEKDKIIKILGNSLVISIIFNILFIFQNWKTYS